VKESVAMLTKCVFTGDLDGDVAALATDHAVMTLEACSFSGFPTCVKAQCNAKLTASALTISRCKTGAMVTLGSSMIMSTTEVTLAETCFDVEKQSKSVLDRCKAIGGKFGFIATLGSTMELTECASEKTSQAIQGENSVVTATNCTVKKAGRVAVFSNLGATVTLKGGKTILESDKIVLEVAKNSTLTCEAARACMSALGEHVVLARDEGVIDLRNATVEAKPENSFFAFCSGASRLTLNNVSVDSIDCGVKCEGGSAKACLTRFTVAKCRIGLVADGPQNLIRAENCQINASACAQRSG
jgi:hypothetical protein